MVRSMGASAVRRDSSCGVAGGLLVKKKLSSDRCFLRWCMWWKRRAEKN